MEGLGRAADLERAREVDQLWNVVLLLVCIFAKCRPVSATAPWALPDVGCNSVVCLNPGIKNLDAAGKVHLWVMKILRLLDVAGVLLLISALDGDLQETSADYLLALRVIEAFGVQGFRFEIALRSGDDGQKANPEDLSLSGISGLVTWTEFVDVSRQCTWEGRSRHCSLSGGRPASIRVLLVPRRVVLCLTRNCHQQCDHGE